MTACCSAMPTSNIRVRELRLEARQAGAGGHAGGDRHDALVRLAELDQLLGHDGRVVGRLRLGRLRPARLKASRRPRPAPQPRGPALVPLAPPCEDGHGRQGRAMEADLVGHGRLVAAALLGAHVDEHRPFHVAQSAAQHAVQPRQVVAGHRADVGDAQVLEQLAGLGEVDRTDLRKRRDHSTTAGPTTGTRARNVLVDALRPAPRARELDPAQVLAERADSGRDAHLVVVEHDQHAASGGGRCRSAPRAPCR